MNRVCLSLILLHAGACSFADALTVVSYNIHHGEGTDSRLDLERIADVLRALHADVVCLQEVDQNMSRTQDIDMPATLSKLLNMEVVFGANYRVNGGRYGNATLTRLPIVESRNVRLAGPEPLEPRGCLRVTVRQGNHLVDVLNTHLGLQPDEREAQAAALVDLVQDRPAVLAGDLNAQPQEKPLDILSTRFRDAARGPAADRATFGSDRRIDYILVSPQIEVIDVRVVDDPATTAASDHRPVVAHLDLGPSPETLLDQGIPSNDDPRLDDALLKEIDE